MMTEIPHTNGVADAQQRLPQGALRRLSRLQAQAELGQGIAQQTAARFQEALAEACDEAGITLPTGQAQMKIDWKTGAIAFEEGLPA